MEAVSAVEGFVPKTPSISSYSDYREFLSAWVTFKKTQRAGFSYRKFSSLLGLKSPNFMLLVIKGERDLSRELGQKLARVLNFKGEERAYFFALIERAQTKNPEEAEKAEKLLGRIRGRLATSPISVDHAVILSKWHHMLIRELVLFPDFQANGEWISERLAGLISPDEAEESVQILLKAGFLIEKNGRLIAQDVSIDTGDRAFQHSLMQKHHAETLALWSKNLTKLDKGKQELGLLHIPIKGSKIPELKARVRAFQDEIIGWLCEENEADELVQLGTYIVPFKRLS